MTYIPHFPLKLKTLRLLRDMHQAELCELTGISRNLIVDIERGRAIPAADQLTAIEEALGVKFDAETEAAFITLAPNLRENNQN